MCYPLQRSSIPVPTAENITVEDDKEMWCSFYCLSMLFYIGEVPTVEVSTEGSVMSSSMPFKIMKNYFAKVRTEVKL